MAGDELTVAVRWGGERRILLRADRLRERAARPEAAAGGNGGGAWRLAGQQDAAAAARIRIGLRHGREQRLRVGMARRGEQPRGGSELDDTTEIDDGNAVRDARHQAQVVADE